MSSSLIKSTGTNLDDILEMNRSLVVRTIKRKKNCSRAELAVITGLKQASITKIIAALIELGIVCETGLVSGARGRRSIGLALNDTMYQVVGLKMARKSFSIGLYDISGNEYCYQTEALDIRKEPEIAFARMKEAVAKLVAESNRVVAIGIAIPGPYLKQQGRIALVTEFPGWNNINFLKEFEECFNIPVYIEHDANAGALAEWWFGPYSRESGVMVHILASEGIGAGIIVDGRLLSGSQGIAGEIGHMSIDINGKPCECGSYGCLEQYCSAIALQKNTIEALKNASDNPLNRFSELTPEIIIYEAHSGNPLAGQMLKQVADYIGYGIVNIVNLYNPDIIVISDILAKGGDILLSRINSVVQKRVLPAVYANLSIELSKFANDPILYGAAAIAINQFLSAPTAFTVR